LVSPILPLSGGQKRWPQNLPQEYTGNRWTLFRIISLLKADKKLFYIILPKKL
jgi:hypothetical protein